jgi:RNA polymerase sigma factor (sigma-70 family)
VPERDSDAASRADRQRLTDLVKCYGDPIYGFARHRVPAHDADDVVNEVFLVAWRRLADIRLGQERAWLFGVARRVILARHRQVADWAALQHQLEADDAVDTVDLADRVVSRRQVMGALSRLSEMDREVLLTAYWYDLSHREAARVIGCSRAALAVRLHRAHRRLASLLEADTAATGSRSSNAALNDLPRSTQ